MALFISVPTGITAFTRSKFIDFPPPSKGTSLGFPGDIFLTFG
jgi:hypothetical protein